MIMSSTVEFINICKPCLFNHMHLSFGVSQPRVTRENQPIDCKFTSLANSSFQLTSTSTPVNVVNKKTTVESDTQSNENGKEFKPPLTSTFITLEDKVTKNKKQLGLKTANQVHLESSTVKTHQVHEAVPDVTGLQQIHPMAKVSNWLESDSQNFDNSIKKFANPMKSKNVRQQKNHKKASILSASQDQYIHVFKTSQKTPPAKRKPKENRRGKTVKKIVTSVKRSTMNNWDDSDSSDFQVTSYQKNKLFMTPLANMTEYRKINKIISPKSDIVDIYELSPSPKLVGPLNAKGPKKVRSVHRNPCSTPDLIRRLREANAHELSLSTSPDSAVGPVFVANFSSSETEIPNLDSSPRRSPVIANREVAKKKSWTKTLSLIRKLKFPLNKSAQLQQNIQEIPMSPKAIISDKVLPETVNFQPLHSTALASDSSSRLPFKDKFKKLRKKSLKFSTKKSIKKPAKKLCMSDDESSFSTYRSHSPISTSRNDNFDAFVLLDEKNASPKNQRDESEDVLFV